MSEDFRSSAVTNQYCHGWTDRPVVAEIFSIRGKYTRRPGVESGIRHVCNKCEQISVRLCRQYDIIVYDG